MSDTLPHPEPSDGIAQIHQNATGDRNQVIGQMLGGIVINQLTIHDRVPFAAAPPPITVTPSLTQKEYRDRRVLLSYVKQRVKDKLEKSLHARALIELGLQNRPDLVQSPFQEFAEFPEAPGQALSEGTSATNVFDKMEAGRTLLILGEPGSGKTITLLKLAEDLIVRTEKDLSQPVPVVFNLSSWAKEPQPLEKWLIQELGKNYKVSPALSKQWVEAESLILLLDGLDEVKAEQRNACAQALNQFMQTHGTTEVIICCRIKDYQALDERLSLRTAICIQPLTQAQVEQYLARAGAQLSALRSVLHQDEELQNLATSPLLLSIMSLAYQNSTFKDILQGVNPADYRKRLFDQYIDRMFQRRRNTHLYPRQQSEQWLIWLAQYKHLSSQTVFLIEQLQPDSLSGFWQKIFYRPLNGLIVGPLEFYFPQFILSGLFISMVLFSHFQRNESYNLLAQFVQLTFIQSSILVAILISIANKICSSSSKLKIDLIEIISLNWKRVGLHALNTIRGIALSYLNDEKAGCIVIVASLLFFPFIMPIWLVYFFMSTLNSGIYIDKIDNKVVANQGFWNSLKNSFLGILIGVMFGEALIFMVNVLFAWWFPLESLLPTKFDLKFLFSSPTPDQFSYLSYIVLFGVMGWSRYGGSACVQHLILRFFLTWSKAIPLDYAAFLNSATNQLFLQKVGGGYDFVHIRLQEHFAAMPLEQGRR